MCSTSFVVLGAYGTFLHRRTWHKQSQKYTESSLTMCDQASDTAIWCTQSSFDSYLYRSSTKWQTFLSKMYLGSKQAQSFIVRLSKSFNIFTLEATWMQYVTIRDENGLSPELFTIMTVSSQESPKPLQKRKCNGQRTENKCDPKTINMLLPCNKTTLHRKEGNDRLFYSLLVV